MSPFGDKMIQGIDSQMESELVINKAQQKRSSEDQKQINDLVTAAMNLQRSVKIKVTSLSKSDMAIDKHQLRTEMEDTMVLQSNIIEDMFAVRGVIEKLKAILNQVVGILYHNLKFNNQYRLKSAKDMETYLAQDPSYNTVNIRIKELQNFVDRSQEFSGMIKQKIGFIRDLTKMRTQEMYSEK